MEYGETKGGGTDGDETRVKTKYRKCSNYCPGRLFNFLRREEGANSTGVAYLKGGAYFIYQFLASNDTIFISV